MASFAQNHQKLFSSFNSFFEELKIKGCLTKEIEILSQKIIKDLQEKKPISEIIPELEKKITSLLEEKINVQNIYFSLGLLEIFSFSKETLNNLAKIILRKKDLYINDETSKDLTLSLFSFFAKIREVLTPEIKQEILDWLDKILGVTKEEIIILEGTSLKLKF